MKITTKPKKDYLSVDLIIENGSTTIEESFWKNELPKLKEMLEAALDDVNYIIDKIPAK